ncbi:hypothetical protein ACFLS1_07190, partial [Verrucomicrobiota bacterium]
MIIRVVLAIDDKSLRKELRDIIAGPDVLVDTVNKRHLLWEHISKESGDIIVVSRSLVPSPEKMSVLKELPESPCVIVIMEQPNAEEEAAFLAGGCDAVLYSTLPSDSMAEALFTILNRRAKTVDEATTSKRFVGTEPKLSDFVSNSPSMQRFMHIVSRV